MDNEYESAIRNFRDHWDKLGKRGYQRQSYVLPKWAIEILEDYWSKSDIEPIADIRDSSVIWSQQVIDDQVVKSDIWNK